MVLRVGIGVGSETFSLDFRRDFLQALLACLLLAQRIRRAQIDFGGRRDLGDQRFVLRRRLPIPERLARFLDQRVDHLDHRLLLLMSVDDSAEHHFLGQLLCFGFDHQHRGLGAGDDEVELRGRKLGLGRIEHVLTVEIADARRGDRAVERNAGKRDRRRGADQRRNIGIDLGVDRHHRRDYLYFVVEAVGKQRPDRPVDQARGQRFLFGRSAFTLEEATRDAAGGIGLFLIVDGQRKEILAGLRLLGGDDGNQHDAVIEAGQDRAARLAGNFARFQRQCVLAVGNRFLRNVWHVDPRDANATDGKAPAVAMNRGEALSLRRPGAVSTALVICADRVSRSACDSCRYCAS